MKNKQLGGYSRDDPLRQLKMRESIFSLAFAVNLRNSKMDEFEVPEECRPTKMSRSEVNLTALFCAFCQLFTSWLLLKEFISQNNDSEEETEVSVPALEDKSIILIKFICAVLFHFKFETEIRNGLAMMKYAALHSDYFENPGSAFFMGFINMVVIIIVEIINLWNLSNITEGTYSLMFDFIALGIIAEFDDYFIEIYRYSNLSYLIDELQLTFDRTVQPKRILPNLKEVKLERLM